MKKGLTSLSDDLEDTVKGINDFVKSLNKALKDLKDVSVEPQVKTVSTSSKKVVASVDGDAKTAAASTLFSLLSGSSAPVQEAPPATAAMTSPTVGGPPKAPGKGPPKAPGKGPPKAPGKGPPKAPGKGPPKAPGKGPPKAPGGSGPPKRSGLPQAPKLPPSPGGMPSKAPDAGTVQTPSFAKRPMPAAGAPGSPPAAAAEAGGGLSSLRDEMLEELNRLKKIMRGD